MSGPNGRPPTVPSASDATTTAPTEWDGARVVVTGGSGFLGRHVVARLIAAGATVHATARSSSSPAPDKAHLLPLDLTDTEALRSVVRRLQPDVVIHLGGHVSGAVDPLLVASTFESLLTSSVTLLSAAQAGDLGRLVLVGTTDEPRPGETPSSPYAAAKAAMTAYAKLFTTAFTTPVVCVRPAETFGPGQAPAKLLPYVAAAALRGERPELSSGRRRGDWVYVDDVADGLLLAARHAPDGADLDLGTGRLRSNREIVEGLLRALGSDVTPHWGARPDRQHEQERVADVDHTARVLGWRATVSLSEGLRRTADAARMAALPRVE